VPGITGIASNVDQEQGSRNYFQRRHSPGGLLQAVVTLHHFTSLSSVSCQTDTLLYKSRISVLQHQVTLQIHLQAFPRIYENTGLHPCPCNDFLYLHPLSLRPDMHHDTAYSFHSGFLSGHQFSAEHWQAQLQDERGTRIQELSAAGFCPASQVRPYGQPLYD